MDTLGMLRSLFGRGKHSTMEASVRMGKKPFYINSAISKGAVPSADNLASIMDAIDYDLLVRSRQDGTEIIIDPPEE